MSFKKEEFVSFPHPFKKVFDAVQATCKRLDWKIEKSDERKGHIEALVGMSVLSWGEKVSVNVSGIDDRSTGVHVTSESYGSILSMFKNPKNINKFLKELEKALSD